MSEVPLYTRHPNPESEKPHGYLLFSSETTEPESAEPWFSSLLNHTPWIALNPAALNTHPIPQAHVSTGVPRS